MNDSTDEDQNGPSTEAWSGTESAADSDSTVTASDSVETPRGPGPSLSADRSLLVGLLALQNGFIDGPTLVDAIHVWITDKRRPMGAILLGWGQVDGEQLAVLEQLATLAIKRDGGDVSRYLSGFGSTPSLLQLLGSLAEDDQVRTLLAGPSTGGPNGDRANERSGSRYRVIHEHAKGGLGAVYLAQDTEVGRKVALKEILAQYSHHDQYRARFLLEAEVTAGLEHPAIVPIYGMGRYEDGRPYYAMRFIKGESLKKAIAEFRADPELLARPAERALAMRGLLRRFLDVCDAIEYAHSRHVIHRDIKPANIMLGKFGETLVVDWGVTKVLDKPDADEEFEGDEADEGPLHPSAASGVDPTQMESACGSPPYMSPEQAAGRVDLVGTLSDVYGLGATLFCLMTGVAPFPELRLHRIKPDILVGKFPRPREVDPTVPPPLESICLKAMALKPEDRYLSSRALADDIERWLADEPVSAHPEPLTVRAARWARNHRTFVVGAAATMLVALAALGVNNYLVGIERDKAVAATEEKAKTLAMMDDTLKATCETLTTVMREIASEGFATTPQFQTLRGFVADRGTTVSRKFLNQRPNNAYIQSITAPIFQQAGVIYRVLGRYNDAARQLREASVNYEQLEVGDVQHRRDHLRARASIEIEMGELSRHVGSIAKALQHYRAAGRLAEQMQNDYPGDVEYERPLARSHYSTAGLLINRGHYGEAEHPAELAIALLDRRIQRVPQDHSTRLLLVGPLITRAIVLVETGRGDEADVAIKLGFEKVQDLVSLGMKSNATEFYRATLLYAQALRLAKIEAGRPEADRLFGESLVILDALVKDFPRFLPYQATAADFLTERAHNRIAMGGPSLPGAENDARAALTVLDNLQIQFPAYIGLKTIKGVAFGLLGQLEPEPRAAQDLLTAAIKLHEESLQGDPENRLDAKAIKEHREALAKLKTPRP